jgi:hypothetical protein
VRNEIKFDHVENWDINAPQTEEEAGESPESLSLELDWSKNITIANYHGVSRHALPRAISRCGSPLSFADIHFRNVHVNAESGYATCDQNGCGTFLRVSKFPYENAIEDVTHHLETREREFAVLDIPENPPSRPRRAPAMLPRCWSRARKSRNWKTDSFPSPAQPWMLPASSISSITMSSASMAGRLPKGSPSSATIRSIP